jgi:predicted dehydrogenase
LKKIAIVGYGSIGKRHSSNFLKLGADVAIVTKQTLPDINFYPNLDTCLNEFYPDIVFICNETYLHYNSLNQLKKINYKGQIVVEKPLVGDLKQIDIKDQYFQDIKVAYNFRFNPMVLKLNEYLKDQKITSATCYVGQYLPTWRPKADYRKSYSANTEQGGGVVLDLSHELDSCLLYFGRFMSLYAQGGKLSDLEINSEDTVSIISSHEKCKVVNINLNYTDRIVNRYIIVNTDKHSFKVDFIKKTLQIDEKIESFSFEANDVYLSMAQTILNSDLKLMTDFSEACHILNVIEKVFKSIEQKRSVEV